MPDSLRILWLACDLTGVCALIACTSDGARSLPGVLSQPVGVDADADMLLRTLAELAREGTPALCNNNYLEKKLNIKIDAPRISASDKSVAAFSEVNPVSRTSKFSFAIYGTLSNLSIKKCYLSIDFKKPFLCNTRSSYIKSILGDYIEYTAPNPGRSTQGVFYNINAMLGGASKVGLGTMDDNCAYGFSISSQVISK